MEKPKEDLEKTVSQFQEITEQLHNLHETSGFSLMTIIIALSLAALCGVPKFMMPLTQLFFIPIAAAVIQQTCYYWAQLCEERAASHVVEAELTMRSDPHAARSHVEEVKLNVERAPLMFAVAETAGLIAPLSFLLLGLLGFMSFYR